MKRITALALSLVIIAVTLAALALPALAQQPDLPEPPARGTTEGPPPVKDTRSFTGGILFVTTTVNQWRESVAPPQKIGSIWCNNSKLPYNRTVKNLTGLSVSGPLSGDQTAGIQEGMRELRPPKEETLTYTMEGLAGTKRDWTLTAIVFEHTRYRILWIRQNVPAENELIGFYDVHKPLRLEVKLDESPHPQGPPGVSAPPLTPGIGQNYGPLIRDPQATDLKIDVPSQSPGFFDGLLDALDKWFHPPQKPIPPIFDYGKVTVYSGGTIAGAGFVGIGESVTFRLPPGSYRVTASFRVIGIPFSLEVASPSASVPIILIVMLQGVEIIWYVLLLCTALAGIVALSFIGRLLFGVLGAGGKRRRKEEKKEYDNRAGPAGPPQPPQPPQPPRGTVV